jgi:hypothetical protein
VRANGVEIQILHDTRITEIQYRALIKDLGKPDHSVGTYKLTPQRKSVIENFTGGKIETSRSLNKARDTWKDDEPDLGALGQEGGLKHLTAKVLAQSGMILTSGELGDRIKARYPDAFTTRTHRETTSNTLTTIRVKDGYVVPWRMVGNYYWEAHPKLQQALQTSASVAA